jgi:uncharacterized cupin superfamily protein
VNAHASPSIPAAFVDVGGFAERCRDVSAPAKDDAFVANRTWLDLPPGAVSIAAGRVEAGAGEIPALPGDECVFVRAGRLTLAHGERTFELAAGEQVVIPRGVPLRWSSTDGARFVAFRCVGGGGASVEEPVHVDTDAPLAPSNPPLAELLIGPTPQCRSHADYRSSSGELVCGTWDSTPYHRHPMTFRHYELMHLLAGRVTFVDVDGPSGTFGAGDLVLFVMGGACAWESRDYVKKAYAYYRPA